MQLKISYGLACLWFILHITAPIAVAREEATGISGHIFGKRGGNIHGFISISEQWTDNLFYTPHDTESDFVTYVSPGIRLSFPGTKEDLLSMAGSAKTPGGLSFGRMDVGTGNSFQTYLSYTPGFEFYAENSDENIDTHLVHALMSWRLRSDLVFELIDQFTEGYQNYDEGTSRTRNKYTSNMVGFNAQYPVSTKLSLRFDYQYYHITYDAAADTQHNRSDNSLSGYAFYHIRPKSSVFIRYRWIDINYEQDSGETKDNEDRQLFGGLRWEFTAKSRGTVQAGYEKKAFDNSQLDESRDFVFEVQIDHQFTPKTSTSLRTYRRHEESTNETTDYTLTQYAEVGLSQQMTYRIQAILDFDYTSDEYKGRNFVSDDLQQRNDQTYSVTIGFNYALRQWLSFKFEYGYLQRESNFDEYDYTRNQVLLRITSAI